MGAPYHASQVLREHAEKETTVFVSNSLTKTHRDAVLDGNWGTPLNRRSK